MILPLLIPMAVRLIPIVRALLLGGGLLGSTGLFSNYLADKPNVQAIADAGFDTLARPAFSQLRRL